MAGRPFYRVGDVRGRLTIVQRLESSHDGRSNWLCRCECGTEFQVAGKALVQTGARPCICARKAEVVRQQVLKTERARDRTVSGAVAGRAKIEPAQQMPAQTCYVAEPSAHTMRLYKELPANLQAAVVADVRVRLKAHRDCGIRVENMDRLYAEAIEIARIEGGARPQERERYEPFRAYTQYQSGKGA